MVKHVKESKLKCLFRLTENTANDKGVDVISFGAYINEQDNVDKEVKISHYASFGTIDNINSNFMNEKYKYHVSYLEYIQMYFDGLIDSQEAVSLMLRDTNKMIDKYIYS